MSEQNAEQTSGESGPVVPTSSDASIEPIKASAPESHGPVESPGLVPEQAEAPKADAPNIDAAKVEASRIDAAKVDTAKADAAKADNAKANTPRVPGKLMIMSSRDHTWDGDEAIPESEAEQDSGMFGKRRVSALAAVVALAALAGALGGALAIAGLTHSSGDDAVSSGNRALEATVARIDADILALKVGVEHTSKLGMTQFNKTSDRLDKVEKAQAEPAARLAKLSEAVDKLRVAPTAVPAAMAAAPAAAKEVTGSIAAPAAAPAAAASKIEVARLPTVDGWVLRDVSHGGALIEGREGIYEVYAGDPVPGLGRIDAVRKQDGRWVVVTSKGLIVAR